MVSWNRRRLGAVVVVKIEGQDQEATVNKYGEFALPAIGKKMEMRSAFASTPMTNLFTTSTSRCRVQLH